MATDKPRLIDFDPSHIPDRADGEYKQRHGVGWTAVLGEQVIGSAGVLLLWGRDGHVGECWIHSWERNSKLALWFHRTIRQKIAEVVAAFKLWRLQAHVVEQDRTARRWIESLGFIPCGLDFHFLPDASNCVRYFRIYKENLPWPS